MIKNVLLFIASSVIAVLLSEGVLRLVVNPADVLFMTLEPDAELGHRIAPGSAGHDAWGLRNAEVPDRVEIVAIGDSLTYGVSAVSGESWPAHLAGITGQSVYNAGLGAYGPLHYRTMFDKTVEAMAPGTVVVALYLGNDLIDAYSAAHGNPIWAGYAVGPLIPAAERVANVQIETPGELVAWLRSWLARNSVLYRLITQSPLFDGFRVATAAESTDTLVVEQHGTTAALSVSGGLDWIDPERLEITQGVAVTRRVLREIRAEAEARGIRLHVALLPVREDVFFEVVPEAFPAEAVGAAETRRASLETLARQLVTTLEAEGIAYTDAREAMVAALRERPVYPPADGHPNGEGYRAIAEAIAAGLAAQPD